MSNIEKENMSGFIIFYDKIFFDSLEIMLEDEEILEIEDEYEFIVKRVKKVIKSEVDNKFKFVGSLFLFLLVFW